MNPNFKKLDERKQERIIKAALMEFAEHGYEQASTNRIVKHAGIGKGMLFHYFNSKQELYYDLVEYALDITLNHYVKRIPIEEPDFIERLKYAAKVKMKSYVEYPEVLHFLGTLFITDHLELPTHLQAQYERLHEMGFSKTYEQVDQTLFRDDVDVDKAYKLIRWAIEGYQNELIAQFKGQKITSINFDPYWQEFYEYLDILKTAFYKKDDEKEDAQ